MTRSRPVLRYFGGKWRAAPWIISHFPDHKIYCEPFGGGASVLMRKPKSPTEIYNDLDSEVVNVFRVVRDDAQNKRLQALLELTPFSRDEFDGAHNDVEEPIERARRTIVRSFMGHGADSVTRKYKSGFRSSSLFKGAFRNPANDWVSYSQHLPAFLERLTGVIVENRNAFEVIERNDSPDTLFYVDPPYPHGTRLDTKHGYRHELEDSEHEKLCEVLKGLSASVILSSYANPIYERLGWRKETKDCFADGAVKTKEAIYLNFDPIENRLAI